MPSKSKPLSKAKLAAYEATRDLAAELLQSVREMKAGQVQVVSSPVIEAQASAEPIPIEQLRNIGPTIARRLREIGIHTNSDLRAVGPVAAFRRICAKHPAKTIPVCYYLYSLEGALRDLHWDALSPEIKQELLSQASPGKRSRKPGSARLQGRDSAMSLTIVPAAESHFEGLRQALDAVAREKRYLAFLQAPSAEEAFAFYRNIVANDLCQFVALQDGVVVGWCDVLPAHGEARAHVGTLGIGVVAGARHRGIGAKLLEAAISKAWAKGLSRIELSVRTDNVSAKALYERFGFAVEGLSRRAFCVEGEFFGTYAMALLR